MLDVLVVVDHPPTHVMPHCFYRGKYEAASQTAVVQFSDGTIYAYRPVSAEYWFGSVLPSLERGRLTNPTWMHNENQPYVKLPSWPFPGQHDWIDPLGSPTLQSQPEPT